MRGTSVKSCRRMPRRVLGTLVTAAALTVLVSGCSSEVVFPAIHDMPAPRADTPLTPDQVKQATDDLISQRDHLQAIPATNPAGNTPPAAQNASLQPAATPGASQTAAAAAKP
jgi:hypothetical protein